MTLVFGFLLALSIAALALQLRQQGQSAFSLPGFLHRRSSLPAGFSWAFPRKSMVPDELVAQAWDSSQRKEVSSIIKFDPATLNFSDAARLPDSAHLQLHLDGGMDLVLAQNNLGKLPRRFSILQRDTAGNLTDVTPSNVYPQDNEASPNGLGPGPLLFSPDGMLTVIEESNERVTVWAGKEKLTRYAMLKDVMAECRGFQSNKYMLIFLTRQGDVYTLNEKKHLFEKSSHNAWMGKLTSQISKPFGRLSNGVFTDDCLLVYGPGLDKMYLVNSAGQTQSLSFHDPWKRRLNGTRRWPWEFMNVNVDEMIAREGQDAPIALITWRCLITPIDSKYLAVFDVAYGRIVLVSADLK